MKLVGITGYKLSGKTTVAERLIVAAGWTHAVQINFADALKEEVAKACSVTVEYINTHKDLFRPILQWWGTEFRRKLHGDSYWILKWLQRSNTCIKTHDKLHAIICSDVRFLNEAAAIRQCNGKLIRVTRSSTTSDGHASETEQDSIQVDYTISNNGTLEELTNQIKQINILL